MRMLSCACRAVLACPRKAGSRSWHKKGSTLLSSRPRQPTSWAARSLWLRVTGSCGRDARPRARVHAPGAVERQPAVAPATGTAPGHHALREHTIAYLKHMVGEALKIPVHRLDVSQPLEKYGVDSLLVVQMTNTLGEVFD